MGVHRFSVSAKDFAPELAERAEKLRREYQELQRQIRNIYEKSDRYRVALDICNRGSAATVTVEGEIVTVHVPYAEYVTDRQKSQTYLGETTVNMLLNGKLLTDEQKLALLGERFGGMFDTKRHRLQTLRWELVELDADMREVRRLALCDTPEQAKKMLENFASGREVLDNVWEAEASDEIEYVRLQEVWT